MTGSLSPLASRSLAIGLLIATLAMLYVAVAQPLIAQTDWHGYLSTPAGREVFANRDVYEKFKWIRIMKI